MLGVILIAAAVFGLCFLVDNQFTKRFRGTKQHRSGQSIRLSKRYGSIGLVLGVLGVAAVFAGLQKNWLMLAGGCLLIATGVCLVIYYMTFGVFYDEEGFVLTTFGKLSKTYRYEDIRSQQLYNSYNNILIELHLADGRSLQLQANMEGVYPFMDKAFYGWLEQKGRTKEECPFYDPQNSCWFPSEEE